jgi:hypothetical protein
MSYDISMNELNDIESQMSQKSKFEKKLPKGGIAFEVRDDFTSGTAKTVSVESKSSTVVRTMSCFARLGKRGSEESLLACSGVMSSSSMVGKLSGVVGLIVFSISDKL